MALNDQPPDDMPALLRTTAPRPGPARRDCLDEETLAAAVDGTLDPTQRPAVTEHLSTCARCRSVVAAVSRIMAGDAVAAEAAAVDRQRPSRRWHVPVGLAAAAAIALLLVWPRPGDDAGSGHRDPTITAGSAPIPLAPVGTVAEARRLQWRAVAGADRYRITLFDAGGRVLYETQVPDTAVTLPDSVVVIPGQSHLWKVEARTGWDRWAASDLVEFRVAAGARP